MSIFVTNIPHSNKIAAVCLLFAASLLTAQPNDPNLIDVGTFEQLNAIRYDFDGNGVVDDDANQSDYEAAFGTPSCAPSCAGFELTTDLDLQPHLADVGETWEPIGDLDNSFNAIFNGNGHIISNLSIEIVADDVGLFGYVGAFGSSNAVVRNLGLVDVDVTSTTISSSLSTGGLAGVNSGLIIGCYVTGTVTGRGRVGGLVGDNSGSIIASYSQAEVRGEMVAQGADLGGLVGVSNSGAKITACYATGNVTGDVPSGDFPLFNQGGLVGRNENTITACYSTGTVSGSGNKGGLVGFNLGTITDSYFDHEFGGLANTDGSEADANVDTDPLAQATSALQSLMSYTDLYASWNLDIDDGLALGLDDGTAPGDATADNPWDFGTESEYPALSIDFNLDGEATAHEFGVQERVAPPLPNTRNPNLIDVSSVAQLNAIRYDLNGDGQADAGLTEADSIAYEMAFGLARRTAVTCPDGGCTGYELTAELDASGEAWTPIGDADNRFNATFNGNGHTLSNLSVNLSGLYAGLFGIVGVDGVIRNLGLEDVNVTNTLGDSGRAGGLAGVSQGLIAGCYVTGRVTGRDLVGGLVGQHLGRIVASYSQAEVVGEMAVDGATIGGLVGLNGNRGIIKACYATGSVTSSGTEEFDIGGLVGENNGGSFGNGLIEASYSTGTVTNSGTGEEGGFVGQNEGTVTASYFDYGLSGRDAAEEHARSTAALQALVGYKGLYETWNLDIDDGLEPGLENGTEDGDAEADSPWDFGGDENHPRLRLDFNLDGTATIFGDQAALAGNVLPATPKGLTATAMGSTQINLAWGAPASDGGAEITAYQVQVSEDGATFTDLHTTADGSTRTYQHTGLAAGTKRYYQVAAINNVGTGAYSLAVSVTTAPTVPAAPANLTATAASSTQIDLAWNAPSSDGGSMITGYALEFSTDGNSYMAVPSYGGTSLSHTHGSLDRGTTYYYRVAAINDVGTSAYSDPPTQATTHNVPDAPTDLTATTQSDTQINLEWQAPNDGGSAITGYVLQFNTDGGSSFTDIELAGTATTYQHTGLTASTAYHYQVAATNNVGTSAYSSVASATTDGGPTLSALEGKEGLRVYPNPASGSVRLVGLSTARTYRVYSLAGKGGIGRRGARQRRNRREQPRTRAVRPGPAGRRWPRDTAHPAGDKVSETGLMNDSWKIMVIN